MSQIIFREQVTAPGTPASGQTTLFMDGNGDLSWIDDGGNLTKIVTSGASTVTFPTGSNTIATLAGTQTFTGVNTFNQNIVFPNGVGLNFGASAGGGATSSILADYEEGTFTPIYSPGGGAFTSITYDLQIGRYVKVGSIVHATIVLSTDGFNGTGASGAILVNLPFTTVNVSNLLQAGIIAWSSTWAGDHPSGILALNNSATAQLYYRDTADGGSLDLNTADFATGLNSNYIYAQITYRAA